MRPNCIDCSHEEVCGIYNALWDAMLIMDKYEKLANNFELELSYMLADNCRQFKSEREKPTL